MVTTDPSKIARLAAALETVIEHRRIREAAVDHLMAASNTCDGRWGHCLDQTSTAAFGSPQYIALRREASKALNDVIQLDQQRKQEEARIDDLQSQEQTLRLKLLKARARDDFQRRKRRIGHASVTNDNGDGH